MAVRREESLHDLLPELNTTLDELSACKEQVRAEKRREKREQIRKERLAKARGGVAASRVQHATGWVDAGKLGAAIGGGGGSEFGPYIRPTPAMLSPMEMVRAIAPDRVYEKGIWPGWVDPSHHSFPFNPRVNVEELCKPLPERFSYLREKLTASRPRPAPGPEPRFPKWVDPQSHPGLFNQVSSLNPTVLTPNQLAAMTAPKRNFDNSITRITNIPTRYSWNDFVGADSLRLMRDDQNRLVATLPPANRPPARSLSNWVHLRRTGAEIL